MNLKELEKRANLLVQKVNEYEQSLPEDILDESTLLDQHLYADLYCLRPVMKMLFGTTISDKVDRTLANDKALRVFASSAPAWNSSFDLRGLIGGEESEIGFNFISDQHELVQNVDMYNNHNMLQLDAYQNRFGQVDDRVSQGLANIYSANIQDALATESQVANLFKWNTTDSNDILNNTMTIASQVPGVVLYYLGQGYDGAYTATVDYATTTLNSISKQLPIYGTKYSTGTSSQAMPSDYFEEYPDSSLRLFIPGMTYTRGTLGSTMQIFQPDINTANGYNYQGKALYHELVFKNRRSGTADNEVDFVPGSSSVSDNDPQGLAIRYILAQQRDYYYNRPWFNELNSLYGKNGKMLADNILKNQGTMTDEQYFTSYQLDYNTYADSIDEVK